MIILSLGGLPFFGGFYSKFYLFMSLINSKSYFLSFVILVCSTISVIYHIRLLRFIIFIPTNNEVKLEYPLVESFSNVLTLLMVILCILNIMMIIFHPYLYLIFKIIVLGSVL
jgi:NADH-quinone oxidoreductase subunit N